MLTEVYLELVGCAPSHVRHNRVSVLNEIGNMIGMAGVRSIKNSSGRVSVIESKKEVTAEYNDKGARIIYSLDGTNLQEEEIIQLLEKRLGGHCTYREIKL